MNQFTLPPLRGVVPDEMPRVVDVAVIGGGIIGLATAFFLARRGVRVAVCEKGVVGGEQSGRNQGWCRVQNRDARELPLILEALQMWRQLDAMLQEETGFRQSGTLKLFANAAQAAGAEDWLARARDYETGVRLVGREELSRLITGATRHWYGGLYAPGDGHAEPQLASAAFARAAQRLGAKVVTSCAVRGIETSTGRVSAVITEHGRIACEAAVLAGGVWSSLFCKSLELRLPQLKTMSSLLATAPLEGPPTISTMGPDFIFRKRTDGGYTVGYGAFNRAEIVPDSFRYLPDFLPMLRTGENHVRLRVGRRTLAEMMLPSRWSLDTISPFERVRVLDPQPVASDIANAVRNLQREFPAFGGMTIAYQWAGLIDVMPDTVPVISPVESIPGFFISSGYSGHGFGIAPAAGKLTADLVSGATPSVDPAPFRFSRLARR